MKRTIIILLIAASVAVTLYINQTKQLIAPEIKRKAENVLLQDALFPARPVWWEDDTILAVGILAENNQGDTAAQKACELMQGALLPVSGVRVEVYDVLKIQQNDDWTLLGSATCP